MPQFCVLKTVLLHIAKAFLLLLAILPSLFLVLFHVREKAIQHRMRKELEKGSLVTITVNKTNFNWVDVEKEIRVEGRMFDVKSYRYENDVVLVTGLFDDEETALVNRMQETQEDKNNNGNKILAEFFEFEGTDDDRSEGAFSFITTGRLYAHYTTGIPLHHIAIITPPPRC